MAFETDTIVPTRKRGRPPFGELTGRKVKVLTIMDDTGEAVTHHAFICESESRLYHVLASYCRANWFWQLYPVCPPNDSDVIEIYYEDETVNYVIQDSYILCP